MMRLQWVVGNEAVAGVSGLKSGFIRALFGRGNMLILKGRKLIG